MAGNGYTLSDDDGEGSPGNRPSIDPAGRRRGHPLGPLVAFVPMARPAVGRLYAGLVGAAAAGLLLVAAGLTPDSQGSGTHRQMGLPPCGFLVVTGLPCPTCGMTTAYAYTVRGRIWQAIHAQAGGFVLGVATLLVAVIAGYGVVSGRVIRFNWYRINPLSLVWWLSIGLVAAWALKIGWGVLEGTVRFQ